MWLRFTIFSLLVNYVYDDKYLDPHSITVYGPLLVFSRRVILLVLRLKVQKLHFKVIFNYFLCIFKYRIVFMVLIFIWIISDYRVGDCLTDQMSISAPGSTGSPVICGYNSGQHSNFKLFLYPIHNYITTVYFSGFGLCWFWLSKCQF